MQIHPYLNFDGQCAEAFKFYEQCLGGEIKMMMTHADTPIKDQLPAEWGERIMHARLEVGNFILMGSDSPPGQHQQPVGLYVSLHPTDPSEADRIFTALAENGKVQMPISETFWARRFGMVMDRFGTPWMVNCE